MRRSAKIAVGIILYALLLFVMIFPFFYMITSSFKHDADVFTQSVFYIPIPPVVNNYVRVWTEIDFLQYYLDLLTKSPEAWFLWYNGGKGGVTYDGTAKWSNEYDYS